MNAALLQFDYPSLLKLHSAQPKGMLQPLSHHKNKGKMIIKWLQEPRPGFQRKMDKTSSPKPQSNLDNTYLNHVPTLCKQGRYSEALGVLDITGKSLDCSMYVCLLQGCIQKNALPEGKAIHAHIKQSGFTGDVLLYNALLNVYAKCGTMVDARKVFDQMPERNARSWTVMIAACTRDGFPEEALTLFHRMSRTGLQPNHFTFATVLPACANSVSLWKGMEIHAKIMKSGFGSDLVVANALIDMYAKCGSIQNARELFDKMLQRDVVSWTALVAGYAQHGLLDVALKLFKEIPQRNVVSWNAMIAGFSQNGYGEKALELFRQMQLAGLKPEAKTFVSVLPGCADMAALDYGTEIHEKIISSGFHSDVVVLNSLIDMYAKCGCIQKALALFDRMRGKDTVSWNTMITGYAQNGLLDEALKVFNEIGQRDMISWSAMISGFAQNGQGKEALKLFQQMQLAGVRPDSKTFASILLACANLAALEQGMKIHAKIIKSGLQTDVVVMTALLDMYSQCGSIDKARKLFDKMLQRDLISWNAMIAGYAMHGRGKEALELFEQMKLSGMNANHVTLVSVLSACSHAGLVGEGYHYFNYINEYYNGRPTMEHYICMVDLLGRAGHLDEAKDFINKMPIKPDTAVWNCLLGACRMHNNLDLGTCVAEHLFELDPQNATPYVTLSNIYAALGRWGDIEKLRRMMKDRGIKKTPGCSWIEISKQIHTFLIGDISGQQNLSELAC